MRNGNLTVLCGLLVGQIGMTALQAQVPALSERVDVRLVEVEAWASDSGEPVLDLAAEELRLFEDGRRVEILFFSPPEGAVPTSRSAARPPSAVPPVPTSMAAAEARNVLVVFLDDAHIAPANRSRVVDSLADWFERSDIAKVDVAIARFENDLEVVLPLTSDLSAVAPKLRSLRASGMRAVEESLDERRTLDTIRQIQRRGLEDQQNTPATRVYEAGRALPDVGSEAPAGLPCSKEMMSHADDFANRVERSSREALDVLGSYAGSLAGLPGRKILLFVSDGIPARPGGAAYDLVRTLCDGSGATQGVPDAIDVSVQQTSFIKSGQLDRASLALAGEDRALGGRFSEIASQASAAGVTVWTYSARGLSTAGDDAGLDTRERTAADQARQRQELEALMSSLAIDTGGRALLEVGDFGAALDQLGRDLDAVYLLAFAVPREADGKLHKIKLETTRKGVRLRHRQSWRDISGEEDLLGLVQGALLHGLDRPGLGATAGIGLASEGPRAGRQVVRVVVPESAMSLLPNEDGSRHGVLRIALAVQAPGARPSTVRSRAFPIERPPLAPGVALEPIVHDIELPELPAGSVVAVGLRDEVDGESGVIRLETAAPES